MARILKSSHVQHVHMSLTTGNGESIHDAVLVKTGQQLDRVRKARPD